jgi:hypothetical protein
MPFAKVYPMDVQKAERKGHTKDEVNRIITWLTGYDTAELDRHLARGVNFSAFLAEAPALNPNASRITGVVCGVRIETIDDPRMQKIRWLDKLIDELAKGRPMEKILRSGYAYTGAAVSPMGRDRRCPALLVFLSI